MTNYTLLNVYIRNLEQEFLLETDRQTAELIHTFANLNQQLNTLIVFLIQNSTLGTNKLAEDCSLQEKKMKLSIKTRF